MCEECHQGLVSRRCPICRGDYAPLLLYEFPMNVSELLGELEPSDVLERATRNVLALAVLNYNTVVWDTAERRAAFCLLPHHEGGEYVATTSPHFSMPDGLFDSGIGVEEQEEAGAEGVAAAPPRCFSFSNTVWEALVERAEAAEEQREEVQGVIGEGDEGEAGAQPEPSEQQEEQSQGHSQAQQEEEGPIVMVPREQVVELVFSWLHLSWPHSESIATAEASPTITDSGSPIDGGLIVDGKGSSTESADGGNGSNVQQQHLMLLTPLRPKEAAEAVQACHAAFTAAAVTAENNLSSDAATEDQLVPGGADAGGIL